MKAIQSIDPAEAIWFVGILGAIVLLVNRSGPIFPPKPDPGDDPVGHVEEYNRKHEPNYGVNYRYVGTNALESNRFANKTN